MRLFSPRPDPVLFCLVCSPSTPRHLSIKGKSKLMPLNAIKRSHSSNSVGRSTFISACMQNTYFFSHLLDVESSLCQRFPGYVIIDNRADQYIHLHLPARDGTQRHGATTTRQGADLGARGVTKPTTGTRTSKPEDSDPQAHKQPTWRHNHCKPDGRKHGHTA